MSGVKKVPQIMQMEALECGAACLAMILAYYGRWEPLEKVREQCGVSHDGSKATNILRAARSYGLAAEGASGDAQALREEATFPCIIFWNFNHFVVLDGFKGKYAYINDPARGEVRVKMEEFEESFTGVVLLFDKTDAFEEGGQRPSTLRYAKERIEDVMNYGVDVPEECEDPEDIGDQKQQFGREKLHGQLDLEDVSFGYSPLEPPLIQNFDLHVEPGSWVALVGPSGCGKSTIAKLVSGLYEPWSGSVRFDGKPLKEIPRPILRGSVAVVDQDIVVFDDSVSDNVKLWDDSIEDYEVMLACRDADIHETIASRAEGYSSRVLPGGRNFSGGQLQRLEIARVLAKDPTVVILDEATSALDAKTEATVIDRIRERAYAELAASIGSRDKKPPVQVDDTEQIDKVVKACLKHMGIKPGDSPKGDVDLEERIDWICRPSGTMHRKVRLAAGWQKEAFGAMVGRLDTGDVVALIPKGPGGYWCLNPSTGKKIKVNAEVARHLDQEAKFFYKPLPSRPLERGDLSAFVFSSLSPSDYLIVLGAAAVVTLVGFLPAWANKVAFGVVVPSGQLELVLPIAALLVGVTITTTLFGICRSLIMARVSIKLDISTESATYARVLSLPASFFKDYAAGELASRMGSLTSLCQLMVSILLGSGLSALLSLVYVFQIFAYAPALAVPALIIVVVQAVLGVVCTLFTIKYERASMEANAKSSGVVTALLNGIQKVKLAGAEDLAFARWAHGYSKYAKAAYNRPVLLYALSAVVGPVGLLGNIVIYFMAATSGVTYDNYMAFNAAFGQTTGAIMALISIAGQIAQAKPLLDMVRPILDANPETDDDRPSVESLSGSVEVSGVSFRYGESLPLVLDNLSFSVKPHEYVAIVGESGCGKSTIMRLLLGFEEPESGSIFYGPHDVRKVNLRSLRRHVGTVMQDSRLFMGDIFSNITISAPSATLDDAWEAAEIAGIADLFARQRIDEDD